MSDPHAEQFLGTLRSKAIKQSIWLSLLLVALLVLMVIVWPAVPLEVAFLVAAVFTVIPLAKRIPTAIDPRSDERFRALAVYGNPEQAAAEIGRALAGAAPRLLKVLVSPEWIVFPDLVAVRPRDVMWVYRNQTTTVRKTYGIETGRSVSHSAVAVVRRWDAGKRKSVRLQKQVYGQPEAVQGLLIGLSRVAPWAQMGYSKELEGVFAASACDQAFRQVDARREGMALAG